MQPTVSMPEPAPDPPRSKPQRIADGVLVALFLVGITVPSIQMIVARNNPDVARTEQRMPATFPEIVYKQIGPIQWPKSFSLMEFPHKFENWFDDHVGFRRPMIRCYNLAKVFGLTVESRVAVGESAHGTVTVGRDGWLYLAGAPIIRDFRRTDPFKASELAAWRETLSQRGEWLAAAGIGYTLFVAPNQQTIYPEFMPRSMTRADRPSRLEQFLAECAREPKLSILDPRAELTAAKSKYPTYHKTDTHWNDYGAYFGYRMIMDEINRQYPTTAALPLESFAIDAKQVLNFGDMVRALNAPIDYEQTLVKLVPHQPRQAKFEEFKTAEGATAFKSTNYAVPRGCMVVFHDSFTEYLQPFLSEHFREVYYFTTFSADAIAELKPDFVLEEFVERRLMGRVAKNPPRMNTPLGPPAATTLEARARNESRR
jgi:alginate O-acetyltransferase complex protein AlgJ